MSDDGERREGGQSFHPRSFKKVIELSSQRFFIVEGSSFIYKLLLLVTIKLVLFNILLFENYFGASYFVAIFHKIVFYVYF